MRRRVKCYSPPPRWSSRVHKRPCHPGSSSESLRKLPWRPRSSHCTGHPRGLGQIPPCFQGQGARRAGLPLLLGPASNGTRIRPFRKHVLRPPWAPPGAVSATVMRGNASQCTMPQEGCTQVGGKRDTDINIAVSAGIVLGVPNLLSSHVPHLREGHPHLPQPSKPEIWE